MKSLAIKLATICALICEVIGFPDKSTLDDKSERMAIVKGEGMMSPEDFKVQLELVKRLKRNIDETKVEKEVIVRTLEDGAIEVIAEDNDGALEAQLRDKRMEELNEEKLTNETLAKSSEQNTTSLEPVYAASEDGHLEESGSIQKRGMYGQPITPMRDFPAMAFPRDVAEGFHAHTYTAGSRIHGTKSHEHENRYGGRSTRNGGITHPLANPTRFGR